MSAWWAGRRRWPQRLRLLADRLMRLMHVMSEWKLGDGDSVGHRVECDLVMVGMEEKANLLWWVAKESTRRSTLGPPSFGWLPASHTSSPSFGNEPYPLHFSEVPKLFSMTPF